MTNSHKLNQIYHSPEPNPTYNEIILQECVTRPERNAVKSKDAVKLPEELTSWGYGSIPAGQLPLNFPPILLRKTIKKVGRE
jgi:hypothetical protein